MMAQAPVTHTMPAPTPSPSPSALRIGRWQVEPALDELRLETRRVKLEPRTMRLLLLLAQAPGEVIDTDTLLDRVWPGLVVTSNSLYQVIAGLRRVLQADSETPAFIATVARKGYRLVAPVQTLQPAVVPGSVPASEAPAAFGAAARRPLGSRSIAVLPFRMQGLPATHGFLRESLLSDLIAELSRQPQLVTIARGTMQTYAVQPSVDPALLAQQLGVRFVVDGSVQCAGDEVRIVADLVDATRGVQVWSEAIDIPLDAWPTLGRRVAGRLARALNFEVAEGALREPPDNLADTHTRAHETAMRAWVELYGRPQSRDTNDRAWQWAREALRADDRNAVAWNALAYAEWRAAQYHWHQRPRSELLADALQHAHRAIALAPRDPDAHHTVALIAHLLPGQAAAAEAALQHCLAVNPCYAPAHGLLAIVRSLLGFPQEAAGHCALAFALSPREPLRFIWHWAESWAALELGDDAAALAHAQQGTAANLDNPLCHVSMAIAAHRLGDPAMARRSIDFLKGRTAFVSTDKVAEHLPQVQPGSRGAPFLDDLRAAGLPRSAPAG
jgi:DNA-binding winged helix-turn-helix (wHTH) protein/tetratricopeptide (TPR) repeat protein